MGFFDKLFKKDPLEELSKLEAMVRRGDDHEKCFKLAQKLSDSEVASVKTRAQELSKSLAEQQLKELLTSAQRSEEAGNFQDALDWLRVALPLAPPDQREPLEQRIEELSLRGSKLTGRPLIGGYENDAHDQAEESVDELDFELHFEMLLGMFKEEVAAQYRALPATFHEGFVAYNNGDMATALQHYLEVSERVDNPYVRFELGRCHVALGDLERARELFETASAALGDDYFDEAMGLSIPLVWGDVMIRLGFPDAVVARLEPMAVPKAGESLICQTFALALEGAGQLDQAKAYLLKASTFFYQLPVFAYLLARVLRAQGEWRNAAQVLEKTVKDSLGQSNRQALPKHPASMRLLAEIYLEQRERVSWAGELLLHIEQALQGALTREDLLLAAKFHELTGDKEAAQKAQQAAESLAEAGEAGLAVDMRSGVSGADQAVL